MPKASKKIADEHRCIFGYGYTSLSPEAVGSPSEEPAQLEAAADLAKRYGLSDREMLLHELNCLAGEWQTASGMYQIPDPRSWEVGRLKIHGAVVQLLEILKANEWPYRCIERRLRHEHRLDPEMLVRGLHSLQSAAAQSMDDGSPPVFKSQRPDTDERRGWLVCQLTYLYEIQTSKFVRAYVDDNERTGNDGSHFVVETFGLLTGKTIKMSFIERVLREYRKRQPTAERPA